MKRLAFLSFTIATLIAPIQVQAQQYDPAGNCVRFPQNPNPEAELQYWRSLNSSWLVELTPLTNGSGPFHHRDDRDNPSWWSTRWLFPNRPDDAKNC